MNTDSIQKILLLAANPIGSRYLRLGEEMREIEEGLKRSKNRERYCIATAQAVRYRDIHRAILEHEPQIIHFSGHGAGEEGLVFEDETGAAKLVDAEALAGLFQLFSGQVECVVLNACYSQYQAKEIARHISYVVGMSQEIGDTAAIEFAVGFYDGLGANKSYEFAYKLGCNAIRMAGIPEQDIPTLLKTAEIESKSAKAQPPQLASSGASTTQFDVFLAHNTQDKPEVRAIALALKQRNIAYWIDEEQIPPGRSFQDEIQAAIPLVKSAAIFIGSQGLGRWQSWELKAFIAQCVDNKIPVIPVLLPEVNNLPEDLVFLKQLRWVSFSNGFDDKAAINLLAWGITGENPQSSEQMEQKPGEIPKDIEPLKYQALLAENQGNLLLAKQLWVRVLAVSRGDWEAVEAIGRIATRQGGSFEPTITNELIIPASGDRSTKELLLAHKQAEIEGSKKLSATNPFPGLRSFKTNEKEYFYGRNEDSEALLKPLIAENKLFVAVIGASGTGKSSLVKAGVLSNSEIESKYEFIEFVPSDSKGDPIQTLASKIHSLEQQEIKIDDIAANLKNNPAKFTSFCQQYYKDNNKKLLLFIDQFEELFTPQIDKILRESFINILLELVKKNQDSEVPFCVVLTIRSDFYHYCIDSKLSELLNLKTDHKLSQPNVNQLMEMIRKPSGQANINVDEVKNTIIEDMVKNNSLPLMAYILEQLHKKAKERGDNKLTLEDYNNLGGIQGVINQQAEIAFKNFSKTQNLNEQDATNILKKVFFKLITINELGAVTRIKAIQQQIYDTDFKAQQLVGSLTKERLFTADVDQITKNPIIEVAHEALFSSWERLKTWLNKVREDLETTKKIVEAAQDWKTKGKKESYLWGGDRLKDAHDTIDRLASYLSDNKEELLRSEIQRLKEKQQSVALDNLKAQTIELEPADIEEFLKPEVKRLEKRLQDSALDHYERQQIGLNLAYIGDTRSGVGLITDELPDIAWCKVPNGIVHLEIDNQNLKFDISESFYIAKYVVTYKQFKAFVDAPDGYRNKKWRQNFSFPEFEEDKQNYRYDNYPRTNVNWYEAMAFCNWLTAKLAQNILPEKRHDWSVRLPTEWEWQLAASGGNQKRDYPWEDKLDGKYFCNDKNSELDIVIAVGMYPDGQSPSGSFDFIGNGFEWCLNKSEWQGYAKVCETYGQQSRAIRSCSWTERSLNLKSRRKQQPQNRDSKTSFRLVYAPTSPKFSLKNLLDTENS